MTSAKNAIVLKKYRSKDIKCLIQRCLIHKYRNTLYMTLVNGKSIGHFQGGRAFSYSWNIPGFNIFLLACSSVSFPSRHWVFLLCKQCKMIEEEMLASPLMQKLGTPLFCTFPSTQFGRATYIIPGGRSLIYMGQFPQDGNFGKNVSVF